MFGSRGTGKSTFIKTHFSRNAHVISLLEDQWESRYSRSPDRLMQDILALPKKPDWVVIDEVQKIPKLLDIVHHLIEEEKIKFILTGSSARKLKRGSANLLAGRAFQYHLFPLSHLELAEAFDLDFVLNWGSLPRVFSLEKEERNEFLRAYAQTYLREEILQEQLVRQGASFRQFLEVAAQENGKTLNFTKIARGIDVDTKTVQSYFQILEDTLVGFFLPAFHRSTRKSVKLQPKFYLFDLGVKKALEASLQEKITPKTYSYGAAFEHFIICETMRLNSYYRTDYTLSHYQTTAGGEIDLILHRGRETIAIEIKSSETIDEVQVQKMSRVSEALNPKNKIYLSQDTVSTKIGDVQCMHWRRFFAEFFKKD